MLAICLSALHNFKKNGRKNVSRNGSLQEKQVPFPAEGRANEFSDLLSTFRNRELSGETRHHSKKSYHRNGELKAPRASGTEAALTLSGPRPADIWLKDGVAPNLPRVMYSTAWT